MEPGLLAETNVSFHGIWKAEYRISDKLVRSIGNEITSKPSRQCILRLTSLGLTLELPPSHEGKVRKTNQVGFDSLRDIATNMYQPKCLMIIYVDSSNKFSIMACSSDNVNDLADISNAYKRHKNSLLQNVNAGFRTPTVTNWTLREKQKIRIEEHAPLVRENFHQSSTPYETAPARKINDIVVPTDHLGLSPESFGSSTRSVAVSEYNNDEDVFGIIRPVVVHEPEDVSRQAVEYPRQAGIPAFNVIVQTLPYEEDFDVESITSAVSQMSSVTSDVTPTRPDDTCLSPGVRSSEVSSEQYFKVVRAVGGQRDLEQIHINREPTTTVAPVRTTIEIDGSNNVNEENQTGNHDPISINGHAEMAVTAWDLRSYGTQTDNSRLGRRYAKRQMNRIESNSYKEKMEAIRKRSASSGQKSPTSPGPGVAVIPRLPQTHSRSSVSSAVSQQRSIADKSASGSQPVKRTLSLGSTTILKPIETVYASKSARRVNSARGHRPINLIIYSATPPNHDM